MTRKIVFQFDERSECSLEEVKGMGVEVNEIHITDPQTGEQKPLVIPNPACLVNDT